SGTRPEIRTTIANGNDQRVCRQSRNETTTYTMNTQPWATHMMLAFSPNSWALVPSAARYFSGMATSEQKARRMPTRKARKRYAGKSFDTTRIYRGTGEDLRPSTSSWSQRHHMKIANAPKIHHWNA